MISVSGGSARLALLEGLRLPSSRLRPSPKPIATEGMPIARMMEQTIAARAEKRKDFMSAVTPGAHSSSAHAGFGPPVVFRVTLGSVCAGKLTGGRRYTVRRLPFARLNGG